MFTDKEGNVYEKVLKVGNNYIDAASGKYIRREVAGGLIPIDDTEASTNNKLLNPFFSQDRAYPAGYTWNGATWYDDSPAVDTRTGGAKSPYEWWHFSPLRVDPSNYGAFVGNRFLRTKHPHQDVQLNPPLMKRAVSLFGSGNWIDDIFNKDPDRSGFATVINSMGTNETVDSSSSATSTNFFVHQTFGQHIETGDTFSTAKTITFGAMVRVPKTDKPRAKNYGFIRLYYYTGSAGALKQKVIVFKNSGDTTPGTLTTSGSNSKFHWSGIGIIRQTLEGSDSWENQLNGSTDTTVIDKDVDDYAEWTKVETTFDVQNIFLSTSASPYNKYYVMYEMGFAENFSNIVNQNDVAAHQSGSIQFYAPYVKWS